MVAVFFVALLLGALVAVVRTRRLVPLLVALALAGGVARADTELGASNAPARTTGELAVIGSTAWTPEKASGLTFDLDPSVSSTLTLSGSTVTHATSRGGGPYTLVQSGSAALPTLDSTHTIGGWPTLATAATGALYSASGPSIGSDTAFTLYTVAQLTSSVGSSYPSVLTLGSSAAASDASVFLGGRLAQWWAGCQDGTLGALGGTIDGNAHVLGLEYDGSGNFKIRVDGQLVGGPTGCTFNTHTTFPVGFGLAPQYSGNVTAFRLARGIFRLTGLDSLAVRRQHEWYLAVRYGLVQTDLVAGVGDSITYGTGSSNPPTTSYLADLAAQTPLSGWTFTTFNDGHPGFTTAQILSVMTAQNKASGARRNSIVIVFAGTNDIGQSVSTATAIANLSSIITTLSNAGYTVLVSTLFDWVNGSPFRWSTADRATINTWILGNVAASRTIRWDLTPEMALVSGGTAYDGTYRIASATNQGHPTDAGDSALARDAAPVIAANKMQIAPYELPANDNGLPWGAIGDACMATAIARSVRRKRKAA